MLQAGGVAISAGGGAIDATAVSSKTMLVPADLEWQGQAKIGASGSISTAAGGTSFMGSSLAVRYVGGTTPANRRFLAVKFSNTNSGDISKGYCLGGDIIEFTLPTLHTGTISGASECTITRSWSDWYDGTQLAINPDNTGVRVGGLWWDEALGVLWYTTYGYYSASNRPHIGAVKLNDDGSVVKYGNWYYRSNDLTGVGGGGPDYWKNNGGYILKIPTYAQSALGIMGMGAMPLGVIGAYGHLGPGLHTFPDFPDIADPAGTVIPLGTRIMEYTQDQGGSTPQARRLDDDYLNIGVLHNPDTFLCYDASAPSYTNNSTKSAWNGTTGLVLDGDVGDILYLGFGSEDTNISSLYLNMKTAAVGGTRVWEYSTGSGTWAPLNGALFTAGNLSLTNSIVAGYWGSMPGDWVTSAVNSITKRWLRMRVTNAFSVAGALDRDGASSSNTVLTPASPNPSGGLGYWQGSRDNIETFAWVHTATKHGIVCFGRKAGGENWYGISRGVTSTGTIIEDFRTPSINAFGYHCVEDQACLYLINPDHLLEVAAATRSPLNTGINPSVEDDWNARFPNIPDTASGHGWIAAYQSNGGVWDEIAEEMIWFHAYSHVVGFSYLPSVQVFRIAS